MVKDFQLKFVQRFVGLLLLSVGLVGLGLYFWSAGTMTTVFENSRLVVKTTQDFILPMMIALTLITIAILGIMGWFLVYLFSHRIAGPIYRIEKHVKGIGEGELAHKVLLRSSDEIQDLAKAVNGMMAALADHVDDLKKEFKRLNKIDRDLVELWRPKGKIDYKDLETVIKKFKDVEKAIEEKLSQLRT